ncbi:MULTISPECIES: flagellin [unclassified Pseudodesulfovibrio]|uniref:flagellin n=1 Tax=unclassified Pseudodesulfovibrio TaxID=2661612 RepID=UPI000FEBF1F7|nr:MULTISPECIES: flagellin [unclassified Pseudodesulfovibrio]MCJ2163794.1 flagellin [Pseudodesulfovibrio sp. S3-i]RWU05958.1 flagellin [Pseudodesulfovibrio sp. S3]
MALTDIEKSYLYDYSMQLLQQDMLTNKLFGASGVGRDLRSLVLGAPVRAATFTNPFEEAISGTLRGDAAAVRQASRNVGEAASMMGVARTEMATINDALNDMEDMIDKINSGELDGTSAVVQSDYDALVDKINGTISNADFNGIAMLDSSQWGTDQIDANGNVYIQSSKDGGFNITFHSVDTPSSGVAWADLDGTDLGADGTRATQLGYVQTLQSEMSSILNVYEGKEDSLQSQELNLQSQAQLLDQAAQLRKPSDPDYSLEQLLADLIARDTGTIYSGSG